MNSRVDHYLSGILFSFFSMNIGSFLIAAPTLLLQVFHVSYVFIALFLGYGAALAFSVSRWIVPLINRIVTAKQAYGISLFGMLLSNLLFACPSVPNEVYYPWTLFIFMAVIAWSQTNLSAPLVKRGVLGGALLFSSVMIGYAVSVDPLLSLPILALNGLISCALFGCRLGSSIS
ncbi:MAG: hypothetical protein ACOYL1_04235 [Chlamydiia bacterium]